MVSIVAPLCQVLVAASLSVYQQKLIFHREKSLCFKAFLNNNWFGIFGIYQ